MSGRHDPIHRATVEIALPTEDGDQDDGCDGAQCESGAHESLRAKSSLQGRDASRHCPLACSPAPTAVKLPRQVQSVPAISLPNR
jgi:hypothetical protein